jgi:phage terminase Nu1 subunit (DNA packaging protein)
LRSVSADTKINKGVSQDVTTVTIGELAEFLGITTQALYNSKAKIVRLSHGAYDLKASVRAYCEHLRETASGRGGPSAVENLTAQRARLAREQADGTALKNAELRGEMIRASEAEARWREVLTGIRARLLAVPSRVRMALPQLSATEITVIDRELRSALEDASSGSA